jgi:hypothetical protein
LIRLSLNRSPTLSKVVLTIQWSKSLGSNGQRNILSHDNSIYLLRKLYDFLHLMPQSMSMEARSTRYWLHAHEVDNHPFGDYCRGTIIDCSDVFCVILLSCRPQTPMSSIRSNSMHTHLFHCLLSRPLYRNTAQHDYIMD